MEPYVWQDGGCRVTSQVSRVIPGLRQLGTFKTPLFWLALIIPGSHLPLPIAARPAGKR